MLGSKANVLLGVGGSIAAYRTPDLAAQLRRSGFNVRTILSQSAAQFVTAISIAAMSRGEVYTNKDAMSDIWRPTHIQLAEWADVAVMAPATAAAIGRLACGLPEGLLTETFIALPSGVRRFIAPAMNCHMFDNPAVQRNVDQLREDGYQIIEPRVGELACGHEGTGKIASINEIVEAVKAIDSVTP
jgi:phosphopantothenoylcysteine synthetase/decarboxylase